MRRYIITLLLLALIIGSLFKAADQTGVRLMRMFGTIGIFLFGVVGTMALSRWQSQQGLNQTETALKSLEPEAIITDWAFQGKGRPDFLVVGPGGIAAICLDETPQSTAATRAEASVAKNRDRVQESVRFVRDRLLGASAEVKASLGDLMDEVPVAAVLVMTRRRALPEYAAGGVTVINDNQLAEHVRSLWDRELLDERTRIKLTRVLREA